MRRCIMHDGGDDGVDDGGGPSWYLTRKCEQGALSRCEKWVGQ